MVPAVVISISPVHQVGPVCIFGSQNVDLRRCLLDSRTAVLGPKGKWVGSEGRSEPEGQREVWTLPGQRGGYRIEGVMHGIRLAVLQDVGHGVREPRKQMGAIMGA